MPDLLGIECAILLRAVSDLCAGFSLRSSWQQVRFESYKAHSAERNKTRGYIQVEPLLAEVLLLNEDAVGTR